MKVRLQLFALARQLAQAQFVEFDLADGATIGDLRRALAAHKAELSPLLPHLLFAIESEYAGDEKTIPPGAAIACIPPVSGG